LQSRLNGRKVGKALTLHRLCLSCTC
jgi:hypothetical protein